MKDTPRTPVIQQPSTSHRLPIGTLLSSAFGAALFALGVLAAFADIDLVPPEMRLPAHPWSLLVLGLLADLPLVAHLLRRASAASTDRSRPAGRSEG